MAKLALLSTWWALAAWAAPTPEFAGSKACFGCHANIYRSFVKTDMGRSMQLATDLDATSIPQSASITLPSGRVVAVSRDSSGWHQVESERNVFTEEHTLDYVVGSGANGMSFLVRRGNYLFQAPLSYYSKTGKWDLSPGYEHADPGFSRVIPAECLSCHSGSPKPVPGRVGEYSNPPFAELPIGCENCHGPGVSHVRNGGKGAIVNPAKLAPRLAENICMKCHQGGDVRILQPGKQYADFRPGEWLIDTVAVFQIPSGIIPRKDSDLLEHNFAMENSRCFRASRARLSCLTCHDPHMQPAPAERAAYFRQKCFTCHSDKSCTLPRATRLRRSPSDDCAGCHMPKRDVEVISHSALTNHRIPARPGETFQPVEPAEKTDLILMNRPPNGSTEVPDITLLRAYGELSKRITLYRERYLSLLQHLAETQPGNPYVQAALGHKALAEGKTEEALLHLAKGIELQESAVFQDMAQALSTVGRNEEALQYLHTAVQRDPYNAVLLKTAILEDIKLRKYEQARAQMQAYIELFPGDSFMRDLLNRVNHP